jgi:hypothetical protein
VMARGRTSVRIVYIESGLSSAQFRRVRTPFDAVSGVVADVRGSDECVR